MNTLLQDIRYGLRMLGKSPGFAAVAILTLALGIGANTAIFSFIDAVMLRSLPVQNPQSLVVFNWLANKNPQFHSYSNYGDCGRRLEGEHTGCSFSVPLFEDMRAQANTFSGLAAFCGPMPFDLSGNGAASLARGEIVSGDFFSTLGVPTILGRPLEPADDSPKASPAMVLSYNYWQSAFGGERRAVGRTVRINNVPVEIVGVASPSFTNLAPGKTQDFFLPISALALVNLPWVGNELNDSYSFWVVIVGRLKPDMKIGQAQAAASVIFRNEMLHGAKPLAKADNPRISLVPAQDGLSGQRGHYASLLYVMMIAVGAILLIACANVAGLMLARSSARQKEMAVRLALGAGRARIIRQLLTESVMLSVAGGALGILLAVWGVHAITALVTSGSDRPFGFVVAPDWRVLAFTLAVTLLTGIFFGLAPAVRGTRVDLTPALKENVSSLRGGAAHVGRPLGRWFGLGDALVVAQVALSILVLVGAGLLVRTLRNLQEINPGFDTQNVLLFGLNPALIGYKDAQSAQLFRDLRERFAALPGVISASYSSDALLAGGLWSTSIHLDGAPRNQNADADVMAVGEDFFSTLRISMLAGRGFTSADFAAAAATQSAETAAMEEWEKAAVDAADGKTAGATKPAASLAQLAPIPVIVNKEFARKFFPKESPIGKHVGEYEGDDFPLGAQEPGYIVLGICGDTKYQDLRSKIEPTMFEPFTGGGAHFELRTASNPTALISAVRSVVARADNNLPLSEVRTQTAQIDDLLVQERMMARISSFFALLALALACIGLYGLLSYEVARRTREIGIRMALGAQQRDVLKLVVGQGIVLALVGVAIGVAVAIGVTRFMASMLYGVHANDPATMIAVAALLGIVALAACYIPARRATRVDPMVALRYE